MKVVCSGYYDQCSVGVTTLEADEALPGYSHGSLGWHGDDGMLYRDGEAIMPL